MQNNYALTTFFEENRKKLFLYLFKLSGDRDDAEDIFQDTFLRYAKKYPDQTSLPLLFTVAKSAFTDMVRGRRPQDNIDDYEPQGGRTPEDELISRRGESAINRALMMLDADDREILAMAGQDGLSYSQIASMKRITEANVKVRVYRARKKLKEILEDING